MRDRSRKLHIDNAIGGGLRTRQNIRTMSHVRFYHAILSRNLIATKCNSACCNCNSDDDILASSLAFTERRYASAVYAMTLCLSVSVTSRSCTKKAKWIELIFGMETFFDLSYTVF